MTARSRRTAALLQPPFLPDLGTIMRHLTQQQRIKIVELRSKKWTFAKIASSIGCTLSTVHAVWNKYQKYEDVKDLPRPGRPPKVSERDLRKLKRSVAKGEFDTAPEFRKHVMPHVSVRTVQLKLHDIGAKAYKKQRKPALTERHKEARLKWATEHKDWTIDDWKYVWFSDETSVSRADPSATQWVWDFPEKDFGPRRMKRTEKFGGGSVKLWIVISCYGVVAWNFYDGTLTAEKYQDLLHNDLLPAIDRFWPQGGDDLLTFQDDNHPAHRAHVIEDWVFDNIESQGINLLPWEDRSPDLNVTENFFAKFKRFLVEKYATPSDVGELRDLLLDAIPEFERENIDFFMNLYKSMPDRCAAVIDARGDATSY